MQSLLLIALKILLSLQLVRKGHCSSSESVSIDLLNVEGGDNSTLHQYQSGVTTTSVKFWFYPSEDREPVEINPNNTHLLNNTQPTKVLIHGMGAFHDHVWIDQMVSSYHSKGNYNVIAVDWSLFSVKDTVYVASAINEVGQLVGNFLIQVTERNLEFLDSVHLIGASVGAQVGAVAGKTVDHSGKGKVDRITGLDPDKPKDLGLLKKDDAVFVDVIHTGFDAVVTGVGTVDFFVTVPGVENNYAVETDHGSNASVAEDIFIMSITNGGGFVTMCFNVTDEEEVCNNNTKIVLGESVPRNVSGLFYVVKDAANSLSQDVLILTVLAIAVQLIY